MGIMMRRDYINQKKMELSFMVGTLRRIYGDDDKMGQSVRRHTVLGCGMSELKAHPDKALDVFLPVILSYGEANTGISRFYNGERSDLKNAVDALLENGVDEFYEELQKIV